jgi:hypothetical protein|tara:strand:- start:106 stop:408 length:303 start_codon:yes stop_codon:yes gene_type:complete
MALVALLLILFQKKITQTVNKVFDVNYFSNELRINRVLVNIMQQLNLFLCLTPYYKLVIFNMDTFSIHTNRLSIRIVKDKNYSNNKNFIIKMLKLRNDKF